MSSSRILVALSAVLVVGLCGRVAAAEDSHRVQIHGVSAGEQKLATAADGATQADYAYSDRGRGEHIVARWTLGADGVPRSYEGQGHDYWAAPIAESFRLERGRAVWKSRVDAGDQAQATPAFYLPANAPPEFTGVLARALLKAPGHRLPLLPSGEARLEAGSVVDTGTGRLTLYRIRGLEFMPTSVWLDEQGHTAAVLNDWFEVLPAAHLPLMARLMQAQSTADQAWHAALATRHTHQPAGALVIRNARLFDPRDLGVRPNMSVLVVGERIVQVRENDHLRAPAGAEVIDAGGRFLMPGMWDVHQHFSGIDGALDLVAGVTSARDMANDNLPMLARVKRFDEGSELGPRVVLAGIIEGTGPLAGPTDVRVDTPEKALAAVDWYADHGYAQIKIYSSFAPQMVALVADRAHARGMRVSGHVPAFSAARQFVEDGADEIQHLNYVVLNFLYPKVQETRGKDRYTVVAQSAREFGPGDPRVVEFIDFLRRHRTVLDPTMVTLEGLFSGEPALPPPGLRPVIARFPPQARRNALSGAVQAPAGQQAAYKEAMPALLRLLKALHDGGVTIMPGSDAFAGYSLHRELELYAQAGIPAAEVLRMATLTPAQVLGVDKDRGVIAPGKLADMVLIDGDPLQRMSDIRRVVRTVKGGRVFDPAAIEAELGFAPK